MCITPRKFNRKRSKNRLAAKRRLIFQPSFFRGELLNFGGVVVLSSTNFVGCWGNDFATDFFLADFPGQG